MRFLSNQKFLVIYSGVLTLAFAITVLNGFSRSSSIMHLKELDVQRINVVEPDGTLRMVISDKQEFPGLIIKGKEYPHPDRKTAGMLFFNDEGTENGGLIFGGYRNKEGKSVSYGHLSFDKYIQDQTVVLEADQNGNTYYKHLSINDQPDYPITDLVSLYEKYKAKPTTANKAALDKYINMHGSATQRLYLGEDPKQGLILDMKDEKGRNRILLRVKPDGAPIMEFLDANGNVISQLPQTKSNH